MSWSTQMGRSSQMIWFIWIQFLVPPRQVSWIRQVKTPRWVDLFTRIDPLDETIWDLLTQADPLGRIDSTTRANLQRRIPQHELIHLDEWIQPEPLRLEARRRFHLSRRIDVARKCDSPRRVDPPRRFDPSRRVDLHKRVNSPERVHPRRRVLPPR